MRPSVCALVLKALLVLLVPAGLVHAASAGAQFTTSRWKTRGVSIVPGTPGAIDGVEMRNSIRQARFDGANTVGLVVQYKQANATSSAISSAAAPPIDGLRRIIEFIHEQHMKAVIKVFFDTEQRTADGSAIWRWHLDPHNRGAWFRAATRLEVGLARLQPDAMIIGTELGRLSSGNPRHMSTYNRSNTRGWRRLIAAVRTTTRAQLSYEAQRSSSEFRSEAADVRFWKQLDYVTLSAYSAAPGSCDPSRETVRDRWAADDAEHYAPLWRKLGRRPILFGEVGYSSIRCTTALSSRYFGDFPLAEQVVDLSEQATGYQGFFDHWSSSPYLFGVLVWNWQPDPAAGGSSDLDFTPQNKPAEAEMRAAFRGEVPQPAAWWPKAGTSFSRQAPVQPFQAALPNTPLDQYEMYWSVDGGVPNPMTNGSAPDGTAAKVADVDLSGWSWSPSDRYEVTFLATSLGGQPLASTAIDVQVGP